MSDKTPLGLHYDLLRQAVGFSSAFIQRALNDAQLLATSGIETLEKSSPTSQPGTLSVLRGGLKTTATIIQRAKDDTEVLALQGIDRAEQLTAPLDVRMATSTSDKVSGEGATTTEVTISVKEAPFPSVGAPVTIQVDSEELQH